jgi:phenylalanyl-tRNA synthetase beta subunit
MQRSFEGTNIGISEQFPEEFEAVRKSLYPELKKARAAGKQARIVKDILIMEGGQVVINNTNAR